MNAVAPASPLEALEFGGGTTNSMTEATAAADATVEINGLLVESSTNSITDAIAGVTLDLLKAEPGVLVTLTVDYDADASKKVRVRLRRCLQRRDRRHHRADRLQPGYQTGWRRCSAMPPHGP